MAEMVLWHRKGVNQEFIDLILNENSLHEALEVSI
jgi:hypothetical protein